MRACTSFPSSKKARDEWAESMGCERFCVWARMGEGMGGERFGKNGRGNGTDMRRIGGGLSFAYPVDTTRPDQISMFFSEKKNGGA